MLSRRDSPSWCGYNRRIRWLQSGKIKRTGRELHDQTSEADPGDSFIPAASVSQWFYNLLEHYSPTESKSQMIESIGAFHIQGTTVSRRMEI